MHQNLVTTTDVALRRAGVLLLLFPGFICRNRIARRRVRWWLPAAVLLTMNSDGAMAQRLEARVGAMVSSTLAQSGPSPSLVQRIPADYLSPVRVKLLPAPIASVGVVHDLSTRTALWN